MSGKGLLKAYNEISGGSRKAAFSSKLEGVQACERAWKEKTSKAEAPDPDKAEAARKLRDEMARERAGGKKATATLEKAAVQVKSNQIREAGEKLAAKAHQPSDGARARKLQMTIHIVTAKNPRREGTDAHRHYEAMRGGVTVLQYLEKFEPADRRTAAQWLSNTVRDGHVQVR